MKTLARSLALTVLAAAAAAAPSGAQQAETPSVQERLASLNATLVRIAELLERQLEGQKIELVMVRVRITIDRMQRTDDDLRAALAEKTSLEDEKERLELEQRSYLASLEGREDFPIDELNRARDQYVASTRRLEARLRDADRRVAELEGQLAGQRREVEEWQDFADRLLAAL